MEEDLNLFCKKKTTSIYFVNGRRPQYIFKWKTISIILEWKTNTKILKMADDLKKSKQPKQNQIKNTKSKQPKTNKNKNNGCVPLRVT